MSVFAFAQTGPDAGRQTGEGAFDGDIEHVDVIRGPGSATYGPGAISGVMGAYLVMYPTARVKMWVFLFIVRFPAWLVLIWWFLEQALTGVQQLNQINPNAANGVAVWAHVGGFICGAVLSRFFVNPSHVRSRMDRVRLRTI